MKIHANMGLHELAEHMGDGATLAEAAHMRASLDGLGRYSDTSDVPESEWLALCEAAAAQAKLDE